MSLHPVVPLIILPPIAFTLTLSSAFTSFLILSLCFRSSAKNQADRKRITNPLAPPVVDGPGTGGAVASRKKSDNDPNRRTVTFDPASTSGSMARTTGRAAPPADLTLRKGRSESRQGEGNDRLSVGLADPVTPVKQISGMAGAGSGSGSGSTATSTKLAQKSPAPAIMRERRSNSSASAAEENTEDEAGGVAMGMGVGRQQREEGEGESMSEDAALRSDGFSSVTETGSETETGSVSPSTEM